MDSCIFCKIIKGEIPSSTIYEDENVKVILDIAPAAKGHAILLVKEHVANVFELSAELAGKVFAVVPKVAAAIKEELAVAEPSVIISRRPCVLLKSVKPLPPLKVDADKCKSCKRCMGLGCPAISMKDGKARIDNTLCVGCGVCKQLCAFDAII